MWPLAVLPPQLISQQADPQLYGCTISELSWIWEANNSHLQKGFFNRMILNTLALILYLVVRLSILSEKHSVGSDTQQQIKLVPGIMPVKTQPG